MAATVTLRINGAPQPVRFGENTDIAARAAARAVTARDEAEVFAATALVASGPNYADTAAGLAATGEGEAFAVYDGDGTISVYRHDAGPAATWLRDFESDAAVARGVQAVRPTGGTNDGQAIVDVFDSLRAGLGGGAVDLVAGGTYILDDLTAFPLLIGNGTGSLTGRSFMRPGDRLRGNGATFRGADASGGALISAHSDVLSRHIVTGPMNAGANVFQLATVGEATDFAVGDQVMWRLGDVPYDTPQTLNWGWARVEAVDTGTGEVTLDRKLRLDWDGTGTNCQHLWRMDPITGNIIEGELRLEAPTEETTDNLIYGFRCYYGRGVKLDTIFCVNTGAAGVNFQNVEDFEVQSVDVRKNDRNFFTFGRGISIAESTGKINSLTVSDQYAIGAYIEFASTVHIPYFRDVITHSDNGTGGTQRHKGIYAGSSSRVSLGYALFEGSGGGYLTHESATSTDGRVTAEVCRVVDSALPFGMFVPGHNCDRLELMIDGVEEIYDAGRAKEIEVVVPLQDGMTNFDTTFLPGIVSECEITFGGGAVRADFTNFQLGRPSLFSSTVTTPADITLLNNLVPAAPTTAPVDFITGFSYISYVANARPQAGVVGNNGTYRGEAATVRISTASTGLTGSGKHLIVRMKIVPNALAALPSSVPSPVSRAMKAMESQVPSLGMARMAAKPTNPVVMVNDFLENSSEAGEVGGGWSFTGFSSANSANSEANHRGIITLVSSATAATVCSLYPASSNVTSVGLFDDVDEAWFVFKENAAGITDLDMRIGLGNIWNTAPSRGAWLEKLTTDTNWHFVTQNAASPTRVDTGVAAGTTGWISLRLRRFTGTDWRAAVNGGSWLQSTTNLPLGSVAMQPGVQAVPSTNNARQVQVDFVSLVMAAPTR